MDGKTRIGNWSLAQMHATAKGHFRQLTPGERGATMQDLIAGMLLELSQHVLALPETNQLPPLLPPPGLDNRGRSLRTGDGLHAAGATRGHLYIDERCPLCGERSFEQQTMGYDTTKTDPNRRRCACGTEWYLQKVPGKETNHVKAPANAHGIIVPNAPEPLRKVYGSHHSDECGNTRDVSIPHVIGHLDRGAREASDAWSPRPPTELGSFAESAPFWVLTFGSDKPEIAYAAITSEGLQLFDRGDDVIPAHHVALYGPRISAPPLPGSGT